MKAFFRRLAALALAASITLLGGCGEAPVGIDVPQQGGRKEIKIVKVNLTNEDYGIGVDKDQPELLEQVNAFIAQVKEDGTFDEIVSHYTGKGEPRQVKSAERNSLRDQLVVASTVDFEPFEYGTWDEQYGIDLELAEALADYLGKELVIESMNFDMMFMSVSQHRCDLCIGGITINDARKAYVDFSDPYYEVGQNLLVTADDTDFDQVKTKEDVEKILRDKGEDYSVGVEYQTTAQYYLEGDEGYGFEGLPVTVIPCKNIEEAIKQMSEGEVDAVLADSVTLDFMVDDYNEGEI